MADGGEPATERPRQTVESMALESGDTGVTGLIGHGRSVRVGWGITGS